MARETSQEEPSMEEILASIRRIISEDVEEVCKSKDALAQSESGVVEATPEFVAELTEEVLELTEEVDDDGNIMSVSEAEARPAAVKDSPVELNELHPGEVAVSAPPPEEGRSPAAEPLIEVSSEDAAVDAFAALAAQVDSGSADQHSQRITPSGRTIEDHILEMLRPMLREWLDKNLPEMVQRLVQREIDRITHRSKPV